MNEPLGACLASAAGCLALGSWAIQRLIAARTIQPSRYEDCPPLQEVQARKQATPTMGGALVLVVAVAAAALFGGLGRREGWIALVVIVGMALLGLADDVLKLTRPNAGGLRKRPKLLVALGLGGGLGLLTVDPALGFREVIVPWLGRRVDPGWLWVPLSMGVVAGSAHAVNLTDGMDGLASGTLAIAFGALGVLSWQTSFFHHSLVPVWCASLAGGCVGFLWFNSHPASVYLGDVGALGLGAGLGALALLSHQALGLLILGGVFVAEAVSVMLQVASYRWRHGRRIFRVAPLHHHVHLGGVHEVRVVVRFWIAGLMLAAISLMACG